MPIEVELLAYHELLPILGTSRKHVLLGNGFSIACDEIFHYSSLYDSAVALGLSARAQRVFDRLGTSNFEAAMRLLDDSHWIAGIYGLVDENTSDMLQDVEVIKQALVQAVSSSHLPNTGDVPDTRKACALAFLSEYYNVFTTNYDLLPYWINMYSPNGPIWRDGFRADQDEPDAPHVVFSERLGSQRGMFFLHGALHLHVHKGELRKHCWGRTGKPLTHLIQEGLSEKRYPLFIAEGSAGGKLEQIQRNGYLWYCLDKLARIENTLVVYGHALGESDQHIVDALTANTKLKTIAIGMFGDPSSTENQKILLAAQKMQTAREIARQHHGGYSLATRFFDSGSAAPWGDAI